MAAITPCPLTPPAFNSRWWHSGTEVIYRVLVPRVLGKADVGGSWRVGVLYQRDNAERVSHGDGDPEPAFWRSLESFYDGLEPMRNT